MTLFLRNIKHKNCDNPCFACQVRKGAILSRFGGNLSIVLQSRLKTPPLMAGITPSNSSDLLNLVVLLFSVAEFG